MDSENATLLCSRLKELRSSLNLTQKEFAEQVGASTVSISSLIGFVGYQIRKVNPEK